MGDPTSKRRPLRRFFRFGIRTVLAIMTLVAMVFGLFILPAWKQKEAVARINAYHPQVSFAIFYDYHRRAKPVGYSHWNLDAELPGPKWLRGLLGEDAFRKPVSLGIHYGGSKDLAFYESLNGIQSWESMSFGSFLDDAMMEKITGQNSLKELRVADTSLTNAGCAAIGKLVSIRELHINQNRISDQGLEKLGTLTRLEELFIGDCNIDGSGFEAFQKPLSLKRLDMERSALSDESGEWIGRFKNLETLYLYQTKVTDQWLRNVGGLPKVTWLNLSGSQITGTGFKDWPVSIEEVGIGIDGTQVDDAGWQIIKSKFPNGTIGGMGAGMTRASLPKILAQKDVTSLTLTDMELTAEDFAAIAKCKTLLNLGIDGTSISTRELKLLLDLENLDVLSVKRCANLDDGAFEVFSQMPLSELNVSEDQYSKAAIEAYDKEHGWQDELTGGVIFTAW